MEGGLHVGYQGCEKDRFKIWFSEKTAKKSGLKDIILGKRVFFKGRTFFVVWSIFFAEERKIFLVREFFRPSRNLSLFQLRPVFPGALKAELALNSALSILSNKTYHLLHLGIWNL